MPLMAVLSLRQLRHSADWRLHGTSMADFPAESRLKCGMERLRDLVRDGDNRGSVLLFERKVTSTLLNWNIRCREQKAAYRTLRP